MNDESVIEFLRTQVAELAPLVLALASTRPYDEYGDCLFDERGACSTAKTNNMMRAGVRSQILIPETDLHDPRCPFHKALVMESRIRSGEFGGIG